MANQLSSFDPVSSFQTARSRARGIEAQEQSLALQPQRNELAQLKLDTAQQGLTAGQLSADQNSVLTKSRFIINSNQALKGIPLERRAAAMQSLIPQAQQAGIDLSQVDLSQPMTDELLDQGIQSANTMVQTLAGPAPDASTSLVKNLKAAGLTEGSPEFKDAVLKSLGKSATTINVGSKGDVKEQEALATGRVSQLTKFRDERESAIDANQSLDVLESIDVKTGALEPAKQGLAAFGRAFGIDTSGLANVAKGEAFNAEAKRIVLSVKASQKGPQTDKDEETIRDTVASLGNTTEGNQFIMDSAKALNNRKIGRADFYDAFLEENETLKGVNRSWSEFKRETPMVSSGMRTPQGLPVFFWKFDQSVRNAHPDATKPEILELWRQANKTGAK